MSGNPPLTPQGNVPAIGIPNTQDYARLIFSAPYFEQIPIAEIIQPSVTEAVEAALPALVPQYVDAAAQAAVQQLAVLLTGSTMSGPLFLSPLMPTQPSQAATMAYVDAMIATAGIPEVPPVPSGQVWARETGQWVPITPQTGVFLPLAGGAMTGNINMSGNTIQNMAAVPAMPNGAAPAQWVLNQIASVSLFQGQWDADTNVPDLTQLSVRVNGYTWIAITTAPGGVVVGPAIPGLQGKTVFNGDTIYYSTVDGEFFAIHAGGLTLPEAQSLFVLLAGSQMSGPLLLNANASQPLQAVTLQQMQAFVPPGTVPEAPNDGQLYGRNGLTTSWAPVLPLAGGILTGAVTLAGNATANLNPVPLQQMTSAITAATAGYLPLAGGTMSGLMTLSGNASVNLNPVPLQQLNAMLASYLPLSGGTVSGLTTFSRTVGGPPGNPQISLLDATGIGSMLVGGAQINASPTALGISTPAGGNLTSISLSATNVILSAGLEVSGSASVTGNLGVNSNISVIGAIAYPTYGAVHYIGFSWNPPNLYAFVDGANAGQIQFVSSDESLKENLAAIGVDCLAVLDQVQLQQFDWKPTALVPSRPHWSCGYIAQNIETLIPEAVTSGPDGVLAVDLMPLMGYVIGALQQLSSRVGALDGKSA